MELPFEFGTISASTEYLKELEAKYGKDYMKPVRFLSAHEYPFCRDEIRVLIGGDTGEILTDEPLFDPSVESIPEEIRALLLKEDGTLKQIILYGLSAADIVNNGKAGLDSIIAQLEEMVKGADVLVFVFVPAALRLFLHKCKLEMHKDYLEMLDKIGEMEKVILDEEPEAMMLWTLISICDEYFGDRCRLEEICRKYDVPITIQDYQLI